MHRGFPVGIVVWFLSVSFSLPAQTTLGTILGLLTDPSGAPVPRVDVVVQNVETGISHKTATKDNGVYEAPSLTPGQYSIMASHPGFKTVTARVLLETSATARVDLRLQVGEVTTAVAVEALTPLINTESADVSSIRTNQQIETGAVNYRAGPVQGFVYFTMVLAPGAQRAQGSNFSFAGGRSTQWGSSLDGTWSRPVTATMQSTMDFTQELRIQLANDKAEAVTSGGYYQTSKSGGNEFHGSLFEYHTSPRFHARNTFSSTVPFNQQHNYGVAVGGPIKRNRTFFSATADRLSLRRDTILIDDVPTPAMKRGDFSGLAPRTVVRDPLNSQPFPGNVIPDSRFSPVSLKTQERFYPAPNTGSASSTSGNWQATTAEFDAKTQFEGRIDHKLSASNSLFGRITWVKGGFNAFTAALPTFPRATGDRRGTSITISDTHTFSPTLINEFRYGFGRHQYPNTAPLNGLEIARELGLQGLAASLPITVGAPRFDITGFTSAPNTSFFQFPKDRASQAVDSVTWIRGTHTLKAGVDLRWNLGSNFPGGSGFLARAFGQFSFTGAYSGFSYADFLLGIPQTSGRSNPAPRYNLHNGSFSGFVQDDWKVSRRLTLNLGVRYDLTPPYTEKNGLFFNFLPASGQIVVPDEKSSAAVNPVFPRNLVPIVLPSAAGLPSNLFYSDRNNFVPRLGFAFRPFADSTTVIRGGYGIYTTLNTPGLYGSVVGGPFVSDETFTNSITGGKPLFAFPQAFPAGFGAIGAQSFTAVDPRLRNPMQQQWSLTLEREVLHTGVRISYIGDHTTGIVWGANVNQPPASIEPFNNNRRRFPALRDVIVLQNGGGQTYHSLHVVAERKMKSGLYYQLGWTWAKNITDVQTDSDTGGTPENSYQRFRERSDADYMPRHRVVGTLLYELPLGAGRPWLSGLHGVPKLLIGGWSLSAIVIKQTGAFFSPTFSGFDVSNTNTTAGRADRIGDGNLPDSQRTLQHWFDASAFRVPGDLNGDNRPDISVGRFGNSAPNILLGPGRFYLSAGLFKAIPVTERITLRLEGTFTNVLNHPFYANPLSNISAPATVGAIRATGDKDIAGSRQGQVGVRIEF